MTHQRAKKILTSIKLKKILLSFRRRGSKLGYLSVIRRIILTNGMMMMMIILMNNLNKLLMR